MDRQYNVVFHGQMVAGHAPEQVRANLKRLLNVSDEYLERMLSGRTVVLKKATDEQTAHKMCAVLGKAGIICQMSLVNYQSEQAHSKDAAHQAEDTATAVTSSQSADKEMVGTIRMGGQGFSGPWTVAEPGSSISTSSMETNAVVPDVDHLGLAPVGAEIPELKQIEPAVEVDISHLRLE